MARSLRAGASEVADALENLRLVLDSRGSKINFRKNIMARYTSAFGGRFLQESVLEEIASQLSEEILVQMRADPRTAQLAEGLAGTPLSEKRGGDWKPVPLAHVEILRGTNVAKDLGAGEAPIVIGLIASDEGEETALLSVRLNHPLYIVMHSGTRPHDVPPVHGIHVFPTREAIAANKIWEFTKYHLIDIRDVPWRDPSNKKIRWKMVTRRAIPAPGFKNPNPFVSKAWARVIHGNRARLIETVTARLAGRSG